MTDKKFRVIIVGAGPTGLAAGLALDAAGIDFIILEQQPHLVKNNGICIFLWPQCGRILDQLGLGEQAQALAMPGMAYKTNMELNGNVTTRCRIFDIVAEQHGYGMLGFQRPKLIDLLHESLPQHESRIRTSARVVDIEIDDDAGGVKVLLEDGSVVEGSIVIGADGVHSNTRRIMQDLARKSNVNIAKDDQQPMTARIQSMYGYSPCPEGVELGNFVECRGNHKSAQTIAYHEDKLPSGKRIDWILFRSLSHPTKERKKYSEQETEEMAQTFFDDYITPGLQFKQLWDTRAWARLVNQEEGFLDRWHWNRIVLVGDSVNKMTSNAGQNFNDAIQSIVVIVNSLRRLLLETPTPDLTALDKIFTAYHTVRQKSAKEANDLSSLVVRSVTWDTWLMKFLDRWVAPAIGGDPKILESKIAPMVRNAPVLDFVPFDGKHGKVPWVVADVKANG